MPDTIYYSDQEVEYHTLLKVAQSNFALGNIQVHNAVDGYIVSFDNCIKDAKEIYRKRVEDLKLNRLAH